MTSDPWEIHEASVMPMECDSGAQGSFRKHGHETVQHLVLPQPRTGPKRTLNDTTCHATTNRSISKLQKFLGTEEII